MLGVPEQALSILQEAIEAVLAHGSVMDKGRALMLMARCQLAAAGFSSDAPGHPGNQPTTLHTPTRASSRPPLVVFLLQMWCSRLWTR